MEEPNAYLLMHPEVFKKERVAITVPEVDKNQMQVLREVYPSLCLPCYHDHGG